ncbi:hypothetical protein GGX14DRAFT_399450 [Mycena pura]|uniref:Uncharacterized protein n=1 Tax=Mycena pura TaxID=153505 RepID=A0AAD6V7X2_9AGAR|nr:hypothetical protein GGX14DRAFT_399450 [Mycena pura]
MTSNLLMLTKEVNSLGHFATLAAHAEVRHDPRSPHTKAQAQAVDADVAGARGAASRPAQITTCIRGMRRAPQMRRAMSDDKHASSDRQGRARGDPLFDKRAERRDRHGGVPGRLCVSKHARRISKATCATSMPRNGNYRTHPGWAPRVPSMLFSPRLKEVWEEADFRRAVPPAGGIDGSKFGGIPNSQILTLFGPDLPNYWHVALWAPELVGVAKTINGKAPQHCKFLHVRVAIVPMRPSPTSGSTVARNQTMVLWRVREMIITTGNTVLPWSTQSSKASRFYRSDSAAHCEDLDQSPQFGHGGSEVQEQCGSDEYEIILNGYLVCAVGISER